MVRFSEVVVRSWTKSWTFNIPISRQRDTTIRPFLLISWSGRHLTCD